MKGAACGIVLLYSENLICMENAETYEPVLPISATLKIQNKASKPLNIADTAYTQEELTKFSEDAKSINISAEESFQAAQQLFFGGNYINLQYNCVFNDIFRKVSEKN